MGYSVLDLDPQGYIEVGTSAGQAYSRVDTAAMMALGALSGTDAMGGTDEAGHNWASQYDAAAKNIFEQLGYVVDALSQVSAGMDASGLSHATAEWQAAGNSGDAPGYSQPLPPVTTFYASPDSAMGGTGIVPDSWHWIADLISATWPDADTGKLRKAQTAWNELASDLDSANGSYLNNLLGPIEGFQAPDIPVITEKLQPLSPGVKNLADGCRAIASACGEFATHVDKAHQDTINELESLVEQIAATSIAGGLLSIVTVGISDAAAAVADGAEIAVAAGRVGEILTSLLTKVMSVVNKIKDAVEAFAAGGKLASFSVKIAVFSGRMAGQGIAGIGISIAGDAVDGNGFNLGGDVVNGFVGGAIGGAFGQGLGALGAKVTESELTKIGLNVAGGMLASTGVDALNGGGFNPLEDVIEGGVGGLAGYGISRAGEYFTHGEELPGGGGTDVPVDDAPPVDDRPYLDPTSRPSFRKGVVDQVWQNAQGPDGRVFDPNEPDQEIVWTPGTSRKGVWDMGHLPEAKYSDMHQRYVDGELTPQEFRDWYNNPDHYRPEIPSLNRSHKYE